MLPVLVPPGGESDCRNYVANCLLVRAGRPQQKLYYNDDVGGRRGRVAVGLTKDTWITYGASDGSSGAMTPEDLRGLHGGPGLPIRRDDGRRRQGQPVREERERADPGQGPPART